MKKYDHMTLHDIATLAREQMHWVSTLILVAKQNEHHAETLLAIAEHLTSGIHQYVYQIRIPSKTSRFLWSRLVIISNLTNSCFGY